jgi:hypothetical protein
VDSTDQPDPVRDTLECLELPDDGSVWVGPYEQLHGAGFSLLGAKRHGIYARDICDYHVRVRTKIVALILQHDATGQVEDKSALRRIRRWWISWAESRNRKRGHRRRSPWRGCLRRSRGLFRSRARPSCLASTRTMARSQSSSHQTTCAKSTVRPRKSQCRVLVIRNGCCG